MSIDARELARPLPDDVNQLGLAVLRYKLEPHTPELITETWQAIFNYWTADASERGVKLSDIEVPALEVNGEVLEKPLNDVAGNDIPTMTILYPSELQGKEGLVFFGKNVSCITKLEP